MKRFVLILTMAVSALTAFGEPIAIQAQIKDALDSSKASGFVGTTLEMLGAGLVGTGAAVAMLNPTQSRGSLVALDPNAQTQGYGVMIGGAVSLILGIAYEGAANEATRKLIQLEASALTPSAPVQ